MKNVWLLVKVLFKQNYRIDKTSKRSKGTRASLIAAFTVLAVTVLPLLIYMLISYSIASSDAGVGRAFISAILFSEQTFALIFGTVLLVNTLFFATDNTFLSTLPVTTRQIFFAKLLYVTFNELIYAGTAGIVASVIYGVVAGMGAIYYILSVIAVIIAPVLSLTVSSILLIPLMFVFSFVKRNTMLKGVFSIIMYVAFMVLYVIFMSKMYSSFEFADENIAASVAVLIKLGEAMFFDYALSGIVFLSNGSFSNILTVVAVWGIGLLVAFLLSGSVYKRSIAIAAESDSVKVKKTNYVRSDLLKTFIIKDFKEITRDSSLLFYCLTQIVIAPLMMILIFGVMYKEMGLMDDDSMGVVMLDLMGTWLLFMFACGTNYVASSSLTRENNHWYLMKIFPVPFSIQVRAKLILAYAFSVISTILGCATLLFFNVGVVETILRAIVIAIFAFGFVSRQIKVDIDKPRLNWTSIAEGMKNNPAMTTSMFLAMGLGFVVGIVIIIGDVLPDMLNIPELLTKGAAYLILIVLAIMFALLSYKSLNSNAEKLFNKLEG